MSKKIGHIIPLDPAKKYLMVVDRTEVRQDDAKRIFKHLKELQPGDITAVALMDMEAIKFVEINGEIELEKDV